MDFDYLTVLSTLRVELFVGRPSLASPPVRLSPVTMSLLALIRDDTYCAFFLLDRIMENIGAHRLTYASSARASAETRAIVQAAEVKVWEEICRAKSFAGTLGCFFKTHDRVTELELSAFAESHGIGLAHTSPSASSHAGSRSHNNEHDRQLHPRHDEPVRAPSAAHAPAVAPVLV